MPTQSTDETASTARCEAVGEVGRIAHRSLSVDAGSRDVQTRLARPRRRPPRGCSPSPATATCGDGRPRERRGHVQRLVAAVGRDGVQALGARPGPPPPARRPSPAPTSRAWRRPRAAAAAARPPARGDGERRHEARVAVRADTTPCSDRAARTRRSSAPAARSAASSSRSRAASSNRRSAASVARRARNPRDRHAAALERRGQRGRRGVVRRPARPGRGRARGSGRAALQAALLDRVGGAARAQPVRQAQRRARPRRPRRRWPTGPA